MRENLLDMTYRLDDRKTAIVHIRTVRGICFDLEILKKKGKQSKAIYKVSLEQHKKLWEIYRKQLTFAVENDNGSDSP